MNRLLWTMTLTIASLGVAQARAQGHGDGGHGGMGGGMPRGSMPGGGIASNFTTTRPQPTMSSNENESGRSGSLQLAPAGRWWNDARFIKSVQIDSQQQRRMDEVFSANKGTLLRLYKNLQHEQSQLEKLARSKNLDEGQIFQQIDRVNQVRSDLEKANAHMQIELRKELTPDQTSRLDDLRDALRPPGTTQE
jgi:Spy/CpxP family protein refolding chaperone